MERGRCEGQNFQLKEVQRLEEEEEDILFSIELDEISKSLIHPSVQNFCTKFYRKARRHWFTLS
jgi:hypothetical protein